MKRAQPSCSRCSGLSDAWRSSNPAKGGGSAASLRSGLSGGVDEILGLEDHLAGAVAFQRVHRHRLGRQQADGEERDRVRTLGVEGAVEIVLRVLGNVVVHRRDDRRIGRRRCLVRACGQRLGARLEDVPAERLGRPQLDARHVRLGAAVSARARASGQSCSAAASFRILRRDSMVGPFVIESGPCG